jgi:hypothetical protein
MCITNRTKFKGEIENYLRNGHSTFDSKIDQTFSCLKVKTSLGDVGKIITQVSHPIIGVDAIKACVSESK